MILTCRAIELCNNEGIAEGHKKAWQEEHHNVYLQIEDLIDLCWKSHVFDYSSTLMI